MTNRIIPAVFGAACTLILGLNFESDSPRPAQDDPNPDVERSVELIIERTNEIRAEHDLPSLAVNEALTDAAQYFAQYMARTGEYGHRADDNTPAERAEQHGYEMCAVLENIAYRYRTAGFETEDLARGFVEGWFESPEHRENMLEEDVTEIGVALAATEDGKTFYAVQKFGRPLSEQFQFTINNQTDIELSYTMSRGDNQYELTLPPRVARTHQVCRPQDIKFSDEITPEPLRIQRGKNVVVRYNDQGKAQASVQEATQ